MPGQITGWVEDPQLPRVEHSSTDTLPESLRYGGVGEGMVEGEEREAFPAWICCELRVRAKHAAFISWTVSLYCVLLRTRTRTFRLKARSRRVSSCAWYQQGGRHR